MRQYVKLKNESESIDEKVKRLKTLGYISDCHIKVGEFWWNRKHMIIYVKMRLIGQ